MTTPHPWVRRSTLVALARGVNAIFFLLTSTYCLLTREQVDEIARTYHFVPQQ